MPTLTATFTGEGVAPSVVSASMTGSTVRITFSESMSSTGVTTLNNYSIPGVTVLSAVLEPGSEGKAILLGISGYLGETRYTITVNNLTDLAGNVIV